ncbi:hypothetical protein ACHWQZ_G011662 [Mnemiopsis leidyi]
MSYMEKRFYLVQSIRLHKPRHRTGSAPADTDASNQKRAYTRVYQFGEVIVCKKFFMKTFGYTSDKFITVALKGVDNETGEVNTVCGQGTYDHKKTHGILEADKKFIEQHVKEKCISLLTFKRKAILSCQLTVSTIELNVSAKKSRNLYDFHDFVSCVKAVGNAVVMEPSDFRDWKNELSQSKASKDSRPLLATVSVAEFRKGFHLMWFKKSFADTEYLSTDFLKNNVKKELRRSYPKISKYQGVSESRKEGIINTLCPLMPEIKICFWENL